MTDHATGSHTEREAWLREHLPHLHVGRTHTGTWHVISAGHGDPLCYAGSMSAVLRGIEEEGPLDMTMAGTLCAHCARRQGDSYAEC